jgi:RNA polymerase-binding transcription factor DksA
MSKQSRISNRLHDEARQLAARIQVEGQLLEDSLDPQDRLVLLWRRQERRRRLKEVERALQAIETGSYGICESCSGPIEPERLRVLPYTTLCAGCKKRGVFEARGQAFGVS